MPWLAVDVSGTVHAITRVEGIDWAAFASIAVAGFTAVLAVATFRLAAETHISLRQASEAQLAEQRRHEDGFQPHITITASGTEKGRVTVRNIGVGLALHVTFSHDDVEIPFPGLVHTFPAGREHSWTSYSIGHHQHAIAVRYRDDFGNSFTSRLQGYKLETAQYTFERRRHGGQELQ